MRAIVQRVTRAAVTVDGAVVARIERGLLVLVGATHDDTYREAEWLARKIVSLRIYPDDAGRMQHAVSDVGGAILAVPQFTLYGDARRGNRPDFTAAARPELAEPLFRAFCEALTAAAPGISVERGIFQAHMLVELVNDGPVTISLETPVRAPAAP